MSVSLTSNFFKNARGLTISDGGGVTWAFNKNTNTLSASGSSGGVLSSVGLADTSTTPIYTVTNSPLTNNGTIDITLSTQANNLVFAGPTTGAAAQPTFRSLVVADIPPAGSTTNVQYNNAGVLAGNANFTFDGLGTLTLGNPSATFKAANATSSTGVGGSLSINSGNGGATSGASGGITLTCGGATEGAGGSITIDAGNAATASSANQRGGPINVTAGFSTGTRAGGAINFTGGAGGATGIGGAVSFSGGVGGITSGAGGALSFSGGNAQTSGAGGALLFSSGLGAGAGVAGTITFNAGATQAFQITANGSLVAAAATGGAQGLGTLNATGLYVNGVAVSTAVGANPTAVVGLAAVNGSASTFMRSDGAPALDVTISPTWSGNHIFSNAITVNGGGSSIKGGLTVAVPAAGVALTVNGIGTSNAMLINTGSSANPQGLQIDTATASSGSFVKFSYNTTANTTGYIGDAHGITNGTVGDLMAYTFATFHVSISGTDMFLANSTGTAVNGNSPVAKNTGWGTPVGNAVINNYNITDAGGANSNTNKAVAQLISVCKAFGLLGA